MSGNVDGSRAAGAAEESPAGAAARARRERVQAYIAERQKALGGNPIADIIEDEEESRFLDELVKHALGVKSLLRQAQERPRPFSEPRAVALRDTCQAAITSLGWIDALAEGGLVDDAAIAEFLRGRE